MNEAMASGARQRLACEKLGLAERTLRRWRKQSRQTGCVGDKRKLAGSHRIPANKLTEEEKRQIIDICNQPEYQSLAPTQIVPRLADLGQYIASESSFYRVLHEVNQVNGRGRASAPRVVTKPKGYKASRPNQIWSWDISFLSSEIRGIFYKLYLIEDIFSRKIVGWEIHEDETAEHASVLISKACLSEGIRRDGLVLHSDNGSPMKGATMLATLQKLGIVASLSRPSVSNDNPYSESLFRTLKYTPTYPSQPFSSLDAARQWAAEFVHWYNEEHRHSSIRFVTPGQRHRGEDRPLLQQRTAVYEAARKRTPERWAGKTRNWEPILEVWLNPPKELRSEETHLALAA